MSVLKNKVKSIPRGIRLPNELHNLLIERAKMEDRNVNDMIVTILKRFFNNEAAASKQAKKK